MTPSASNSSRHHPPPSARIVRPPERTSRLATHFAVSSGSRIGSTSALVPRAIRLVAPATSARVVNASRKPSEGVPWRPVCVRVVLGTLARVDDVIGHPGRVETTVLDRTSCREHRVPCRKRPPLRQVEADFHHAICPPSIDDGVPGHEVGCRRGKQHGPRAELVGPAHPPQQARLTERALRLIGIGSKLGVHVGLGIARRNRIDLDAMRGPLDRQRSL